ncbi:hypothetical protein [Thomasclavelia sp.]
MQYTNEFKNVVCLYYICGDKTLSEVAKLFNIDRKTLKNWLSNLALRILSSINKS